MSAREGEAKPPTPEQTALLDFLLQVPFSMRAEIVGHRERFLYRSSCTCGCASFSAHVDGQECTGGDWKLPPEASSIEGADPVDVLLFGCAQGLHVEVVDHLGRKGRPLPAPSELALISDPHADDGAWS